MFFERHNHNGTLLLRVGSYKAGIKINAALAAFINLLKAYLLYLIRVLSG